jgi:hypothetical protein
MLLMRIEHEVRKSQARWYMPVILALGRLR